MYRRFKAHLAAVILAALYLFPARSLPAQTASPAQWSIGYWSPFGSPPCPISDIDWAGLTHLAHYAALANPDGTLDLNTEALSASAPALIAAAHANGVQVLLDITQPYWTGQTDNLQSAATGNLNGLLNNIMSLVNSYGYDGVDIDWEPFDSSTNGAAMQSLVTALKAQLGARPLTVAALPNDYRYWGSVAPNLDRVNVLTYDLTGTWNPYSWHNAALYDQDRLVWSVNLAVTRFTANGVPASKLGIGIPFYGWQWFGGGITGPRQHWTSTPYLQQIPYQSIVPLIPQLVYQWDSLAGVPYLSGSNTFVTYDNEQSVAAKVNYAKNNNLGGWVIWNLASDYFPAQTPKHPLLTALKNAMAVLPSISTTSPLPAGTAGTAYSQTLTATGTPPITWTMTGGAPPPGLALSPAGVLSGTPGAAGTFTFTVQAANLAGSASKQFSLAVQALAPPVVTTTSPLPNATAGTTYSQVLIATGSAPITWTVISGTLPAGLSLTSAGILSGRPDVGGTFVFTVQAVNIAGSSARQFTLTTGTAATSLGFYPVRPCRLVDTRPAYGFNGAFGPPAMAAGSIRDFPLPAGSCGIPSSAQAYSLNVTAVPAGPLPYLTMWPSGQVQPAVSTLNAFDGGVVSNAAIVPAGIGGSVSVYVAALTDLIVDINGYFAPPDAQALAFYPITPCRVADTRPLSGKAGAFGSPSLSAGSSRNFPIPTSSCGIPSTAQAYSLNVTVQPPGPLAYLTTWPAGQPQPNVSTLNSLDGRVVADAAIVPAGAGGAISVYVSNTTDVIIDANGYFAPPGLPGALYFYSLPPCRVADTRSSAGFPAPFGPPNIPGGSTRGFPVRASSCGIPSTAQAYSLNITVQPPGPLAYLTTWPGSQPQPPVSTLNSFNGRVVANAALVPAGTSGVTNVYVSDPSDVIIDGNGYFAP